MQTKKFWVPILLVVFGLFVLSCGSGSKEAATAALKAAEDAVVLDTSALTVEEAAAAAIGIVEGRRAA